VCGMNCNAVPETRRQPMQVYVQRDSCLVSVRAFQTEALAAIRSISATRTS
jgi:hypothetical protein